MTCRTFRVIAACGHWWTEYQPVNLALTPNQPRVCVQCRPDVPAAVGTSPQGFAMVHVEYERVACKYGNDVEPATPAGESP